MKPREIRDLSVEELTHKIEEIQQELFRLRIQNSTGQLKNTARMDLLKKDIARIKTILRDRSVSGPVQNTQNKG